MTTARTPRPRRDTLSLHIAPADCNLIDRAAASAGMTRARFILGAARRAAEETLLDRASVASSPDARAAFLQRLDKPAQPNDSLQRTMRAKPPWQAD